jgi:hypothetical protein
MNLPRTLITIYNRINEYEYNWTDDAGFHQYYCTTVTPPMKGTIDNFSYINNASGRIYSWVDNVGLHNYYTY